MVAGVPIIVLVVRADLGECIDELCAASADVDARARDTGRTALMEAAGVCSFEQYRNVQLLVHAGADMNLEDSTGRTALDIAIASHCPLQAEYLAGRGAICSHAMRLQLERLRAQSAAEQRSGRDA